MWVLSLMLVFVTRTYAHSFMSGCSTSCNNCCGSEHYHTGNRGSWWDCWRGYKWGCAHCKSLTCGSDQYQTGACGGTTNTLTCHTCSNRVCGSGQYRKGSCSGRNDGYSCHTCSNKECGAGHYRGGSCSGTTNGYACSACSAGKYQSSSTNSGGASSCSSCSQGKVSSGGAQDCSQCANGKFANSARTGCSDCPLGKYSTDGASCEACPPGKISTSPVSGNCEQCDPGSETDKKASDGGTKCVPCKAGHYLDGVTCSKCEPGYYAGGQSQVSCAVCAKGTAASLEGATACDNCHSGKYAPAARATSCSDCSSGKFTSADSSRANVACSECSEGSFSAGAASSCTACPKGQSQAMRGADTCESCSPGKYADNTGLKACLLCDKTAMSYEDATGSQTCSKQCSSPDVPASNRASCTSCAAEKGPNSFLGLDKKCAYCAGCAAGGYKSDCGCNEAQSSCVSCAPCSVGFYKDSDQSGVGTEELKGAGWDTVCTPCTVCPAGKIRTAGDACFSNGATAMGECKDCSPGFFKKDAESYADVCTACQDDCGPGKSRIGCNGANEGSCTAWPTPIVTAADGPGILSGFTSGYAVFTVYGQYFGPVRSGSDASDVVVTYGDNYVAQNCAVTVGDLKDDGTFDQNIVAAIRCETVEGVGKGHSVKVRIGKWSDGSGGGYAGKESELFAAGISYQPPIVATYAGEGSSDASTFGGQTFVVTGANFGPMGTVIQSAVYGDGKGYTVKAENCNVTIAHTQLTCRTGPGAGIGNKLVVTIAGQASSIPTIDYGAPYIRTTSCVTDDAQHGKIIAGELRCSCSKCASFGGVVPAITVGKTPCWWRKTDASPCSGPGTPSLSPTADDVNGTSRLSTLGNQLILISGGNFGNDNTELEAVSYGPTTGKEVTLPIYASLNEIPKSTPGCAVWQPSFSIVCNTEPGIAGPHKFVVSVRGQSSMTVDAGSISYSPPNIEKVEFSGIALSTAGSQAIDIIGTEFGTNDKLATYKVIFSRGDNTPRSSCEGVPSGNCFEILASKGESTGDGKERVRFISPSAHGLGWSIRMIVTNSFTSQSNFADYDKTISYGNPAITAVTIEAVAPSGYQLVLTGSNFCNSTECGAVHICSEANVGSGNCSWDASASTLGGRNRNNYVKQTRILLWSHLRIILNVEWSLGSLYVAVDNPNDPSPPQLSTPIRSFSTEMTTVVPGGSFSMSEGSSTVAYTTLVPTVGGRTLILHVNNLPEDNSVVTVVVNRPESGSVTVQPGKVTPVIDKVWAVEFTVPAGSGAKQEISVTRNGMQTQNRAYIWYAKPTLESVVLVDNPTVSIATQPMIAGSLPTRGAQVLITGSNLGDFGANMNGFHLRFKSSSAAANVDVSLCELPSTGGAKGDAGAGVTKGACTTIGSTHSKLQCTLPAGSGIGFQLALQVGGQTPVAGFWPASLGKGDTIAYSPPVVKSITPNSGPTTGETEPNPVTITGSNFGALMPTVEIAGSPCVVVPKSSGDYHNSLQCNISPGVGQNHEITVTSSGGQRGDGGTLVRFSYDAPIISSITPSSGRTDGMQRSAPKERQIVIVMGKNFGAGNSSAFEIRFGSSGSTFFVPATDVINRTHTQLAFFQPEGWGAKVGVTVSVAGQQNIQNSASEFSFDGPVVAEASPNCGVHYGAGGTENSIECYGYSFPGYLYVEDYPKIISITVASTGIATVRMRQASSATPFNIEVGDKIRLSGMSNREGIDTGSAADFNGDWTVTGGVSGGYMQFDFDTAESKKVYAADLYMGWDYPKGNLRALAAKWYQLSSSSSFQSLETDGCGTESLNSSPGEAPLRASSWEPYSVYKQRLLALDSGESNDMSSMRRQCTGSSGGAQDMRQTIVITGANFGSHLTPVKVMLARKKCDCHKSLGGVPTPCMHTTSLVCSARVDGKCPTDHSDCSLSSEFSTPVELEIKISARTGLPMHSHESIVAVAPASFGRRHKLSVSVGTDEREAPFSKEAEQFFGYLPPTVTGFETSASQSGENAAVFSPDGKTRLTLLGYNLGFVTGGSEAEANFSSMVTVQIGTEFDVDGSYCGDEERCMKLCEDPRWFPTKLKGEDSTLGFPYIDCIIPVDTAGFKNISVSIAGQIDDCRTNRLLCGLPINFPVDRRQRPLGSTERISDLVNDASKGLSGLVFTCAKSSQAAQSYAKPGELCQDEPNGVCADADCTAPKANPGFWRLDLDLQFACNQGTALSTEEADGGLQVLPCQADYAKLLSSASNEKSVGATVMSALNPFDTSGGNTGVSLEQVCAAGIQQGTGNRTQCAPDYRLCSDRGTNPPGSCIFRRPEEARRALGSEFWPWACPEVDMTELMKSSDVPEQAKKNAMRACRSAAPDAFGYVESLSMPNCPAKRTKHLVDPSVYRQYPGLEQSTTCYGIVACNPKESCLGDNKCAPGYEYNKHRCEAWNAANPGRSNCTSDDDCRSRSGRVAASNGASAGLSSACDHNNPEDCARCVVDDTTGLGTCECMGGGPRCGLCRLAGGGIDPATGKKYKGYYRLNDECQECPENPALLIALMVLALVAFCVIGWWMQDKKVNVAFLSIGVDYFQVLAIFARIKVRWPLWVKQILQVLSVFNFNIDIAAPECIMPDFDYRIKWIMMMSLPLMFAAMLWMINCTICLKKWIGFRFLGRSRPKYSSHGGKLVAMFIVVFYFAYLTVTRRALDIFNCNPAVPDDGYLYTEFTSIDCPGGTCICDDPAGLQYALKPWAVAGFCIYSLGFPAFVAFITWYYHYQIKADQLLRAYNMGDERSRTRVYITQRGCFRSIDRNMYDIRKKYHKLYYHFKPGKVYWMLVILARKLLVALFALLFRRNVAFLLSCVLLVLFGSYVLQVRNKPYMSQVERADVREAHRQKVLDAEAEIGRLMTVERVVSEHAAEEKLRPDLRTHLQINRGINAIEDEIRKRDIRRGTVAHQNVSSAIKAARDRKTLKVRLADYYFDYNTVEQILIMCSIFLSLVAIMFESGQFYKIDPATGLEKLDDDPSTSAFYTTILVFGAIALIGSLVYYSIVLVSEVFGHAPNWLRKLCATKTNALQKRDARAVGMGMGRGDSLDDGNFEMAETHLTQYANPLKDLEAAKASEKEAQEKAERFKKMFEKSEARSGEMVDMVRKLKQKNARQSLDANARSRAGTKQTAGAQARSKPKKEFAAQLKK